MRYSLQQRNLLERRQFWHSKTRVLRCVAGDLPAIGREVASNGRRLASGSVNRNGLDKKRDFSLSPLTVLTVHRAAVVQNNTLRSQRRALTILREPRASYMRAGSMPSLMLSGEVERRSRDLQFLATGGGRQAGQSVLPAGQVPTFPSKTVNFQDIMALPHDIAHEDAPVELR